MPFVPINWLAEHVELPSDLTAAHLAADLVKVGLEEEAIHPPQVTGPLVVGKVLTREAKEQKNGKVINYCRVDVGQYNDEPGTGAEPSDLPSRGIICGAHNFEVGDYVVAALPGCLLPGDFAIAARKTYGHISDGMLCSFRELGLEGDNGGIIILQDLLDEVPSVGTDVKELLGITGELLEINITPDRGYCFSMRGIAREYSHSTGAKFTDPGLPENLPSGREIPAANEQGFPVIVTDEAPIHGVPGCSRYVARILRGFNPAAPTPKWMQTRLADAGMRSISLAVDVTNYVMLDLGQPLHAYDLQKLSAPLVVRRAYAGENLITLDDVTRELDPQDLVIADSTGGQGARPLCLAGVMGGASSEITAQTTDILVESAYFDAITVARTARRHKLPSESAKRNERGTDPLLCGLAAQRCIDLLQEYGGGEIGPEVTDYCQIELPADIVFGWSDAKHLTGVDYEKAEIARILELIGCQLLPLEGANGDIYASEKIRVKVPSWRPDLVGPAHLVEEIARINGYDQVPSILPAAPSGAGLSNGQKWRRQVAQRLADAGWVQVLSYPFIGDVHDRLGLPADDARRNKIRLANPLAEDAPYLRTSILDTLLTTARRNFARGLNELAIFELDRVVCPLPELDPAQSLGAGYPSAEQLEKLYASVPAQPYHVGAVASGKQVPDSALGASRAWDWADAIAAALEVTSLLGIKATVSNAEYQPWHPGRCAEISATDRAGKKQVLGYAGQLHPQVCTEFELPNQTVAFELDLEKVFACVSLDPIQVAPVSTFPAAKEDFAFVVDASVPAGSLVAAVEEAAGELAESVNLFDVFTGAQIGEDKKSVAVALWLRSPDHTLGSEEISAVRTRVIKAAEKLGATLRS